ncbi:hypothetical protein [Rugosimonospora africana]|nr:hypothetical protein [Rugosimonospora africana]
MSSSYSYEPTLDLYAIMITDDAGEDLCVVLGPEEFEQLQEWSNTTVWRAEALGLEATAIRALL